MATTSEQTKPVAVSYANAAKMLDCSRQHIYELVARGVLRSVRIETSRAVRIPVVDVFRALGLDPAEDDS